MICNTCGHRPGRQFAHRFSLQAWAQDLAPAQYSFRLSPDLTQGWQKAWQKYDKYLDKACSLCHQRNRGFSLVVQTFHPMDDSLADWVIVDTGTGGGVREVGWSSEPGTRQLRGCEEVLDILAPVWGFRRSTMQQLPR